MTTGLLDVTAAVRACVFTLAGEPFALDVARIRELTVFDGWTTVPRASRHVIGAANLRGDVVPIADARALLGLPAGRGGRRLRTLVVAADGLEAALVIDEVLGLEAFAGVTPLEDAGPQTHGEWALGFLRREDRLVPLLDPARLLRALRAEG
ncbi:MAG TPA: chemotaxis protein CheW [Methylomirabilota bacterium]|nr:chemotaxis protein CheW [Methylomirabilota bacterium]